MSVIAQEDLGRREPSSLRLVLTLAMTGLLSGLVLVGVYLGTLPRIQRNQAEALRKAIFQVLPGTAEISTLVLADGKLVSRQEGTAGAAVPTVYAGRDEDGRLLGYAVPADGPGFMDTVGLIYGIDVERGVIVGMQVLESRETPGLGDKIVTDEAFLANFAALEFEPSIDPVKKGAKSAANEVDCITGATISSEAVVSILNRSKDRWLPLLQKAVPAERTDER